MGAVIQMLGVSALGASRLRAGHMVHDAALVRIEEADLLADATEAWRAFRNTNGLVGHKAVRAIAVGVASESFAFLLTSRLWPFLSPSHGRVPALAAMEENGLFLRVAVQHRDVLVGLLRWLLERAVAVDKHAAASVAVETAVPLLGPLWARHEL